MIKELIKLHNGTMSIESNTASESPDGSHGSTFTVTLPLGKDHLSAEFIEESASASEVLTQRKYALGIIEEASSWIVGRGMGTPGVEGTLGTPSEFGVGSSEGSAGSGSGSGGSGGSGGGGAGSDERESSEGSRLDRSMLFFSKTDVILLGALPPPSLSPSTASTSSRSSSSSSSSRPALPPPIPRPLASPSPHYGSIHSLYKSHPWPLVGLPPYESWPQSLKTTTSYILASTYPSALWWGPSLILMYNDAYASMSLSKHPSIFGKAGSEAWGELWDSLGGGGGEGDERGGGGEE